MTKTGEVRRGNLVFDVTEAGPPDGEPVLLLHGFPQTSECWDGLVPLLTEAGYRTVAMDQRGYSPRARPKGRRAYLIEELVDDVVAAIDHYGGSVHVVGHDLGAAVAWVLTAVHPEKVRSLTAVSVPHPAAFRRALVTSRQIRKSWYIYVFQVPLLPELRLRRKFVKLFVRRGQTPEHAHRDRVGLSEPGALTAVLNWYRAMPLWSTRFLNATVHRPTLFVWSDDDVALDRKGAELSERHVEGPYEFQILHGVSHWIPDEAPEKLAALLLPHLKRWSNA